MDSNVNARWNVFFLFYFLFIANTLKDYKILNFNEMEVCFIGKNIYKNIIESRMFY